MKIVMVALALLLVAMLPAAQPAPQYIYDASKADYYQIADKKIIMGCPDWEIAVRKLSEMHKGWVVRARRCGSINNPQCAVEYLTKNWLFDRLVIAERKLYQMRVGKPGNPYGVPEVCPKA